MIRTCLNTNVLISAVIFDGKPERILDFVVEGKITLVISPAILLETTKVLMNKFKREEDEVMRFIKLLYDLGEVIKPIRKIRKIDYSPDNQILACAQEGKADYIVTGDKKHLLPLKRFEGIPIVTPSQFLKKLI